MNAHTVCTRCVMDTRVPGILFDADGVCNYCHLQDTLVKEFPKGEEGRRIFDSIIDKIKREGAGKKYDCIVGISGGTDSSYMLYKAVEIGLRPLAVHYDNTWNSSIATENIRKITKKLKVDLFTHVVDNKESDDIFMSFLKASIPWADSPTDLAINSVLYRTADKYGIKNIIVAADFRTEGKQPIEWAYCDGRMVKAIHKTFGRKPMKTFPNLTLLDFARYSLIKRIKLIRPLNYIEYKKSNAREILEREFGWEYYGGHHHEGIFTRFTYAYYIPVKFNVDQRLVSLSAIVRSGEITRQEALEELKKPSFDPDEAAKEIDYLMKRMGFSRQEFDAIMTMPPRSFRDYPSYYPFISAMKPFMKIAMKLALSWTPPMFYEMEMRDKK